MPVRVSTSCLPLLLPFLTFLLVLNGCATTPPPLPAASPLELPGAWIEPLTRAPCPPPFRARLQIRVKPKDHSGVTLEGSLQVALPDTVRVSARLGAFRPVFAIRGDADSCEILFHEGSQYWITPRGEMDWRRMNPSTWCRALHWALCSRDLLGQFLPDDTGRMEGRRWRIRGGIRGTPYRATIEVDPRSRSVRLLEIEQEGEVWVRARPGKYRWFEKAWMPTEIELELPDLHFRAALRGVQRLAQHDLEGPSVLRPPGWHPLDGEEEWLPRGLGTRGNGLPAPR